MKIYIILSILNENLFRSNSNSRFCLLLCTSLFFFRLNGFSICSESNRCLKNLSPSIEPALRLIQMQLGNMLDLQKEL